MIFLAQRTVPGLPRNMSDLFRNMSDLFFAPPTRSFHTSAFCAIDEQQRNAAAIVDLRVEAPHAPIIGQSDYCKCLSKNHWLGTPWQTRSDVSRLSYRLRNTDFNPAIWQGVPVK